MKQLSSMDLYFLTRELQALENQRIDTFYYENDTFYVKVYISGQGNKFLTNKRSKYIYLDDEKPETQEATSFTKFLRKNLKNGFIRKVRQIDGERILEIEIEKMINDEIRKFYLIIEIFSNGNIIVCDENKIVREAASKRKFKDRKVMVKDEYQLPPQKELTISNLNENLEVFSRHLKESDLTIVKYLAIKLGMGGKFAEEVCAIAKVDKNLETVKLSDEQVKQVTDKLEEMLNMDIDAQVIMKDDSVEDFMPFKFESIALETLEKSSFNEAVKLYFKQFKDETDAKEQTLHKELKKLQNRLQKQEQQLVEVEKDYEKYNNIGNKVYENYAVVEELLNSINKSAKEKGWEHVVKTIEETPKLKKLIKKLNYKNNEIILNLD